MVQREPLSWIYISSVEQILNFAFRLLSSPSFKLNLFADIEDGLVRRDLGPIPNSYPFQVLLLQNH